MRFWLSTVLAARFTLAIFAAALALGVDASAHHSTAFFDGNKTVTIQGRVVSLEWQSPHIYLIVETTEPGGEVVTWRFESVPIPIMTRQGWTKDSLKPGEQVTVEAFPLKDELTEPFAWILTVTKEDGTVLDPGPAGRPRRTEA